MSENDAAARAEQAAAWRMRLGELRIETCEEFELWLASDPRNAAAWYRMQLPWELFGDHATAPEIIDLRRAALAYTHNASASGRSRVGRRVAGLGLCAAALVLAAGFWVLWQSYHFDQDARQAPSFRAGKDSADSEAAVNINQASSAARCIGARC
jgi:ferric-dicitrate binding protein FerR (iron transport regulator)